MLQARPLRRRVAPTQNTTTTTSTTSTTTTATTKLPTLVTSPPASTPSAAVATKRNNAVVGEPKPVVVAEEKPLCDTLVCEDAMRDFSEQDRIAARTSNVNGVEIIRPTLREAAEAAAAAAAAPPKMMWDYDEEPPHISDRLIDAVIRHREEHGLDDAGGSIHIELDNKRVPAHLLSRFEDWEIRTMQLDALSTYTIRRNRAEIAEVCRSEVNAREDLVCDATATLDSLYAMERDAWQKAYDPASRTSLYDRKLIERRLRADQEQARREDTMREKGREAWRQEVAERAQQEAEHKRLAAERRTEENRLRAAMTFISSREASERETVISEELQAWTAVEEAASDDRAEMERIAYELFMNSPEQLAIAAEQKRKEVRARKRAARAKKQFEAEQKRMVTNCRHGRNGASLLDGVGGAKRVCARCRVRFDDELGHFVADPTLGSGGTSAPARRPTTTVAKKKASSAATASAPTTKRASTAVASAKKPVPNKGGTAPAITSYTFPAGAQEDPQLGDTPFSSPIVTTQSSKLPPLVGFGK